jgi:lipopolysaccharide heptosyltransferase II
MLLKNINFENIKSILIIRLSSLGDILLSTPLIRTLKNKYAHIEIDIIVKRQYYDVIAHNPHLRNKYSFSSAKRKEILSELKKQKYDLILDLQNNLNSRKLTASLKGKTVRFKKKTLEKFLLVNTKINLLKYAPQIPVRYAETIQGFELDDSGLDIVTTALPSDFLLKNENYIGICPGSRHFTKMWSLDYYVKLCRLLIKNGWNILLFGGLTDRKICLEIKNQVPEAINLQNDDDILQTAANMILCKAIYCNDSGLMHTACAAEVPIIAFFGSTVKEFGFTPYKNKSIILEIESLSCRPCSHIGKNHCPKKHFKCMTEISPQKAYEALEEVLKS